MPPRVTFYPKSESISTIVGRVAIDRIVDKSTDAAASLCPAPHSSEKLRTTDAVGQAQTIKKVFFTSMGRGIR